MRAELRTGRVTSIDAKRHSAQVTFDEVDGFRSHDLQVLATRPGDYSLPAVDSLVLCALLDGTQGTGFVLGCIYSDEDAAPTDDSARRVVAGDDVRLGAADAEDKVALAPATKSEIQKVLDFAKGIADAINNATPFVPNDGGASVVGAMRVLLAANPVPTLEEPAAEKVSAK